LQIIFTRDADRSIGELKCRAPIFLDHRDHGAIIQASGQSEGAFDPLKNLQKDRVDEAKLGVYWVLEHTIKLAPGKVGPPIRLATLRMTEGKWIAAEQDTQEFSQYVEELENHIGKFIRAPVEEAAASPPPAVPAAAI
jgi:hypothetical protein